MAAAYAALLSLLNTLEDIQNHQRHSFYFDKNQIQSLAKSVSFLIEFMESYDNCHGPSKDAAQLLERRITCAAHAAEEVIESHVVDQIRGGSTLDGKTRPPRLLLDVEKVIQDMDYVMRKAIKIQQMQRDGVKQKQPTYKHSLTQPLTKEKNTNTMVGFDDLLLQLLDMLTGYPSSRRVIPIVGTGGVGKTTLAKNAFEHPLIVQHFDVCLWVTISQQYVVQDILSTLLSHKQESNSETVYELGEQLHKRLYGRRYLIVLDDIWSVTTWDEMKPWFPDTSNRSRIIMTTRQSDVADHIGSSRLAISLLDDDKSWDLFCQKAFAGEDCPLELEDVGKNIVRKLKGLPLAIVVIAGHLGKLSRTQECWKNVAKNMKSVLNSKENNQFFNILSYSYIHLPIHLKPCFVYMGTLEEDREINIPKLIRYWIVEGFVKSCNTENLEELAERYLKDLIDRNLILDSTTRKVGTGYKYCKIHDLLRELCLKVAENERFFYLVDNGRAICRERRVGIKGKNQEENCHQEIFHPQPLVRSLLQRTGEQSFDLRLCRVLKYKEVLANEVDEGFLEEDLHNVNLRYFKYYSDHQSGVCRYLPSSISLFWNLQTLIIVAGFYSSFIAPNEIWDMIQLRHLQVDTGIHLPDPPPSHKLDQGMRNLHTLMVVENLTFSEEVCKRVSNIKELEVRYCFDEAISYYCTDNLGCLLKLKSLNLNIVGDYEDHNSVCREFALKLTLPSSLKKLSLCNTHLDWEEMIMMVGSLPHLETLYLDLVRGSEWTFVEGKFLFLKSLTISRCHDLVKWNADSSHFPVLEHLVLEGMYRSLNELPSDLGTIPTLCSITLNWCNVSLAVSAMRMVVEQEEEGNESLRLNINFLDDGYLESFNEILEEEGLTSNNMRATQF